MAFYWSGGLMDKISPYQFLGLSVIVNIVFSDAVYPENLIKKYHIDYAFADKGKFPVIKKLSIGEHLDWLDSSDHMPIFIEI